jgi:uncharacterized protein YigE (DUF2233 family)
MKGTQIKTEIRVLSLSILLLVLALAGCRTAPSVPPTAIVPPTATAVPSPIPATTTPSPDSGWLPVRPGLERRHIFILDAAGQPRDRLTILRLEPALFDVRVAYRPGEAQSLEAWQAETGALITLNGGYFTEDFLATGLVVVDGEPFGASYGEFAGMLAVSDGGVDVRWLGERPYDPAEPLRYGLQSFPMLVKPGGVAGYPEEDGAVARRTVIGEDGDGRLLLMAAPLGGMTLHQLSQWLAASDLGLDTAVNLDGGTSTGLLLQGSDVAIPAFVPLPVVITVHEK